MNDLGKQFEKVFLKDWKRTFPGSFILRLPDQISGYKTTSKNICDYIGFNKGTLYLLECKSHKGNTLPFQNISQYDKLVENVGIEGVRVGVIIWFYEHDKVWYVPISTISKMKEDGKKSVNVRTDMDLGYNIIEIPSIKKRTFLESDYSILTGLKENE